MRITSNMIQHGGMNKDHNFQHISEYLCYKPDGKTLKKLRISSPTLRIKLKEPILKQVTQGEETSLTSM